MTEKKKYAWPWGLIIVGTIALVLPILYSSLNRHRLKTCMNDQRNIALALSNYQSGKGRFPPACVTDDNGKPLYSWRVLLIPFVTRSYIFDEFRRDEPWDSPHNKKLAETDMSLFRCHTKPGTTNHVLVTGPGTIWEDGKAYSIDDIPYPNQTLMLVEIPDLGIPWAEPFDLKIDDIDPRFLDEDGNFKTNHPGYVTATFADGHTTRIPQEKILPVLKELSQIKQEKKENFEY